jgi:cell division protein FtsA
VSRSIITGIDIGTATVRVAVAEPRSDNGSQTCSLLGYGAAPAAGMRRGVVVDVEEAARSIRYAVDRASKHAGVTIDRAYIGFGGSGLGSVVAKGIVAVSRADGEISEADVERAHTVARANLPVLNNREILQEVVTQYVVDKETNITQPTGMIGNRLEVHILYITGFSPHLRNLVRAVEAAGISVEDIAVTPLATAHAMLSKHKREIGVLLLDLGGETATCSVFEEGTLLSTQVFPVGAMHITNDVAIGFQVPLDVAEAIKITYGIVAADEVAIRRDTIRFAEFAPDIQTVVSRWDLAEIVDARTTDIFELVEKYLRKIGRSGLLPAGVVLVGGGAHLAGIVEFSRRALRLPTSIGTNLILDPSHELAADPAWAVVVGLCVWGCGADRKNRFQNFVPKKIGEYVMRFIRPLIP